MEKTPSPEIRRKTRRKNYTYGEIKSKTKKSKPVLKTSTPVGQASTASLEKWLQSGSDSEQTLLSKIPLNISAVPNSRGGLCESLKRKEKTVTNVALDHSVDCVILPANTLAQPPLRSPKDAMMKETENLNPANGGMFGFENLLNLDDGQCCFPATTISASNGPKFSSTVLTETKVSHFMYSPDHAKTKKASNKRRQKKLQEDIQDVHLFGENADSPTVQKSVRHQRAHKVDVGDTNEMFSNSDDDVDFAVLKQSRKRQTKAKPMKPIVPDIPWKEIMEHELVIE